MEYVASLSETIPESRFGEVQGFPRYRDRGSEEGKEIRKNQEYTRSQNQGHAVGIPWLSKKLEPNVDQPVLKVISAAGGRADGSLI